MQMHELTSPGDHKCEPRVVGNSVKTEQLDGPKRFRLCEVLLN